MLQCCRILSEANNLCEGTKYVSYTINIQVLLLFVFLLWNVACLNLIKNSFSWTLLLNCQKSLMLNHTSALLWLLCNCWITGICIYSAIRYALSLHNSKMDLYQIQLCNIKHFIVTMNKFTSLVFPPNVLCLSAALLHSGDRWTSSVQDSPCSDETDHLPR